MSRWWIAASTASGEKVVVVPHMALGGDRGIRRRLPSEPAKAPPGRVMAVSQVAQAGLAGHAPDGPMPRDSGFGTPESSIHYEIA
jgi:hypothetical protein